MNKNSKYEALGMVDVISHNELLELIENMGISTVNTMGHNARKKRAISKLHMSANCKTFLISRDVQIITNKSDILDIIVKNELHTAIARKAVRSACYRLGKNGSPIYNPIAQDIVDHCFNGSNRIFEDITSATLERLCEVVLGGDAVVIEYATCNIETVVDIVKTTLRANGISRVNTRYDAVKKTIIAHDIVWLDSEYVCDENGEYVTIERNGTDCIKTSSKARNYVYNASNAYIGSHAQKAYKGIWLEDENTKSGYIRVEKYNPKTDDISCETASINSVELYTALKQVLSHREYDVLSLRLKGYSNKHIAYVVGLSERSVKNVMQAIRSKVCDTLDLQPAYTKCKEEARNKPTTYERTLQDLIPNRLF